MSRTPLWLITITVLVAPPVILWVKPESYTPVLAAVFSGVLFAVSRLIGHEQSVTRAVRAANDRWLPQSESAIHRLLTVLASIKSFKSELSETCRIASKDIPELENDENKPLKLLLSTHCRNGGARLGDVVNHLDDAITDWSRFVEANCQGEECARISRALKLKKDQLETQLRIECGNTECVDHSQAKQPVRRPESQ